MEVVIEIRTSFIDGGSVYMEKERGVKRGQSTRYPVTGVKKMQTTMPWNLLFDQS